MAKIIDNPQGGRRSIRLSAEDVSMVISAYQLRTRTLEEPNFVDLQQVLEQQPIMLPEEL